jgi:phage shock protein A
MLNDFILRAVVNLLEQIKVLGTRVSTSETELAKLKAQHELLETNYSQLQKNYDELLSLILE